jgi:phospholipid/cholesterol/gamma-HCH transport system ATP-binding protein
MTTTFPFIEITDLKIRLGDTVVHDGLSLSVQAGEILAIVGGSGSGKTTLLREMLLLDRPDAGSIRLFNQELTRMSPVGLRSIQRRWGVLFQQNALFSSLTVLENTAFPLHEHTKLDNGTINKLALLKILAAGLSVDAALKYPSELSGGMQKRAALARAMALDPQVLFLDEPTSGLDPDSAAAFDELVINLKTTLGLTIVMVTHDLDSLWKVTDRVAFLGEKRTLCVAPIAELAHNPHPLIQAFFSRRRDKTTKEIYGNKNYGSES